MYFFLSYLTACQFAEFSIHESAIFLIDLSSLPTGSFLENGDVFRWKASFSLKQLKLKNIIDWRIRLLRIYHSNRTEKNDTASNWRILNGLGAGGSRWDFIGTEVENCRPSSIKLSLPSSTILYHYLSISPFCSSSFFFSNGGIFAWPNFYFQTSNFVKEPPLCTVFVPWETSPTMPVLAAIRAKDLYSVSCKHICPSNRR